MSLGEGAREPKKQPGLRLSSDSFYPPWTLLAAIITWLSYLWDSSSNKHRKVVWEKEKKTNKKPPNKKPTKLLEDLPSSTLTCYCFSTGTVNFKSTEDQWQTTLLMENI